MEFGFSPGKIVQQVYQIFFANFLPFTLIAFLCLLPAVMVQGAIFFHPALFPLDTVRKRGLIDLVLSPFSGLFQQLVTGAIVFGAFEFMRGKKAGLARCFAKGFQRFVPVFSTAIVSGFAITIGFLLCVVPGLILLPILYVAVPVAVIEKSGLREALKRSSTLTDGFRGEVFAISFLVGLPSGVLIVLINNSFQGWAQFVARAIMLMVFSALGGVSSSVVYFRLRQMKESVQDIEEIASVFD